MAVRYNEIVIHRRVLFNDQVHDSSEKLLVAGQVGLLAGWAQQRNPRDFGGADGASGKQMS